MAGRLAGWVAGRLGGREGWEGWETDEGGRMVEEDGGGWRMVEDGGGGGQAGRLMVEAEADGAKHCVLPWLMSKSIEKHCVFEI